MLQLTQKLGSGEMLVQEVPLPQVGKNMVLVKTHYSLISAGTESSTVSAARKNLIQKAKERPQQVKQVIDTLKTVGPVQTYRAVKKKLDAYSPLGYSSAGEVIAVGEEVAGFEVGDKVACAGLGYANHAEIISVPVNLCVKLDPDANLKDASYNTLGAIALQGIRQADLRLGESCVVIGLGLLGQLTGLMLKASGVKTFGIDINPAVVEIAKQHSFDEAWSRNEPGLEALISDLTDGIGVDVVIITAATPSHDPVNFAGKILRKKGQTIIVGAVPTGFEREYYYKKELELKMSCSYGPGRYDLNYEEKGIDYPVAYVRWTENRNMQAFQYLLSSGKIDLDFLTTHEFSFQEAPAAYDLILNKTEPYLGITLKYDTDKRVENQKISTSNTPKTEKVNVAFIGAGSYAQGNLLPYLPDSIGRKGVLTNTGTTSKRVAEKFKFEFCTAKEEDVFDNKDINTVFIATRHDSHAEYVLKALKNQKHVFVEKPICLKEEELEEIKAVYTGKQQVMVGFNRRFSPLSEMIKKKLGEGAMSMIYRINAGNIPSNTWIQDMEIGGGRILGEVCHFIDYLTWMNGSNPTKVFASALPDPDGNNDTLNINITFENGSTGVVAYYANGAKSLPKEYIEVFKSGAVGVLDNFKKAQIYGGKKNKKKLLNQDKGQEVMVKRFIKSLETGEALIPFDQLIAVTNACFAVLESLKTGNAVAVKS